MSTTKGDLPAIINGDPDIYDGNLKHYFRVVFLNAKNLQNPYHNFRHIFHVMFLCYQALVYYRREQGSISKSQGRALLIAAMFHDFDHPGKTGNDDLNIEFAIRGIRKWALDGDQEILPMIESWIRATEFPYKNDGTMLPLPAKILRDADSSQAMSVAWIQQIIFGLSAEMSMTPTKVLQMQEGFLHKLTFLTDWAELTFPRSSVLAKAEEANELAAIINEV